MEHNELMNAAWVNASLTAYAPAKARDFVKIEKLLVNDQPKHRPRQTWQQQLAVAQHWTAALAARA